MEDFGEILSIPYEGERICQGFTYDYKDCEKNIYYFSISRLYKHEIFAKIGRYYGTTLNWLILYSSNLTVSDRMLHYFNASSFQSIQIIRKLMIWKCNLSMMWRIDWRLIGLTWSCIVWYIKRVSRVDYHRLGLSQKIWNSGILSRWFRGRS